MAKFDLSEKISFLDVIKASPVRKVESPFELIREKIIISGDWQENYFNWGRNALYFFFKSLNIKKITFPAFTCPTLTEAAEKAKKEVILSEVDLNTFNLDITKIPQNTQCLVAVHTFGNPLDISKIRSQFKNIFLIEDCAHALFAKINNRDIGSQGDAILFSLYKQIVNLSGALLLTKKKLDYKQESEKEPLLWKRSLIKVKGIHQPFLDILKKQYLPKIEPQKLNANKPNHLTYFLFKKGFNNLETEIILRNRIAEYYYQEAQKSKYLICQKIDPGNYHSYCYFGVRLIPRLKSIREKVALTLRKKNIFVDRLWYEAPIVQKKYAIFQKQCPNALLLAQTIINLPILSSYKQKDVQYLFFQINKTIEENI